MNKTMAKQIKHKCDVCGKDTIVKHIPLNIVKGKEVFACLSCELDITKLIRETFFQGKKKDSEIRIYVSYKAEICFVADEEMAEILANYSFTLPDADTANNVLENLNTFYIAFQDGKQFAES